MTTRDDTIETAFVAEERARLAYLERPSPERHRAALAAMRETNRVIGGEDI